MDIDLNLEHLPVLPRKKDFRIGAMGAGFIMRDIQFVAYQNAGFNVVAIASRDPARPASPPNYAAYPEFTAPGRSSWRTARLRFWTSRFRLAPSLPSCMRRSSTNTFAGFWRKSLWP